MSEYCMECSQEPEHTDSSVPIHCGNSKQDQEKF